MTKIQIDSVRKMSRKDKLKLMEIIWDDLTLNPENVPTPNWHKKILTSRLKDLKAGKTKLIPYEEVKRKLKFA